jgi:hypothetical protein
MLDQFTLDIDHFLFLLRTLLFLKQRQFFRTLNILFCDLLRRLLEPRVSRDISTVTLLTAHRCVVKVLRHLLSVEPHLFYIVKYGLKLLYA